MNRSSAALTARRDRLLGENTPLFYDDPVHIVRGEDVWLYDAEGKRYLDCYNNVPHVGHCHPRVVDAIHKQASTLNTHTRYLHEGILDYVERLTSTFHSSLSTAIMACTGSEANDIALRMAHSTTGRTGIIATDSTYHGNTAAVSQLSTKMPPIGGVENHVRHVPTPDSYRPLGGQFGDPFTATFIDELQQAIDALNNSKHGFSALIVCPYFANEGFPDLPDTFMKETADVVHNAGGIIIADEVQPGFGRLGTHMWGHERVGIVPDVVTLGKPMANGHPVGAVVTTSDIMKSFRSGYRYFNTFGGNPVSCAAAMAVLDVLEEDQLMDNAASVGMYAKTELTRLADRHDLIGDIRGQGLFFGAELVTDRDAKTPAPQEADQLVNLLRQEGILTGTLGVHRCTLKIRPPMTFTRAHTDLLIHTLDELLSHL